MLGPLEHDRPRPGGGRSAGGGQPGRPAADDGDIPFSTFSHAKSLGEPAHRAVRRRGAMARESGPEKF
jgi:hypothetical protein